MDSNSPLEDFARGIKERVGSKLSIAEWDPSSPKVIGDEVSRFHHRAEDACGGDIMAL